MTMAKLMAADDEMDLDSPVSPVSPVHSLLFIEPSPDHARVSSSHAGTGSVTRDRGRLALGDDARRAGTDAATTTNYATEPAGGSDGSERLVNGVGGGGQWGLVGSNKTNSEYGHEPGYVQASYNALSKRNNRCEDMAEAGGLLGRRESGDRSTLRPSFHPSPHPSSAYSAHEPDGSRSGQGVDETDTLRPRHLRDDLRQRFTDRHRQEQEQEREQRLYNNNSDTHLTQPAHCPPRSFTEGVLSFRNGPSPIVHSENSSNGSLSCIDNKLATTGSHDGSSDYRHIPTPLPIPNTPSRPSLSTSSSSSLTSSRTRLVAPRSRVRPRPILPSHYSHTSNHAPAPYPTSLPSARRFPFTYESRFKLPAGMTNPSTPTTSSSFSHTPALSRRSSGQNDAGAQQVVPPVSASLPGNGRLASPSGTMSMTGRRQAPPAWPSSPRREAPPASHREILARSAGLPPLGYAQTPTALRVPPSAQWSPAFHRSGYARQQASSPYRVPTSPTRGYPAAPHSANPIRRKMPSSAPSVSSPRMPDQPKPPSPSQVTKTQNGTYRYKDVSVAWVVGELHNHASRVWNSPETADCKIVIPAWSFDKRRAFAERASPAGAPKTAVPTSAMSAHSNQPGRSYWPPTPEGTVQPAKDFASGIGKGTGNVVSSHQVSRGRRPSLPEHDEMPILEFPLHQDYLITQSKLLRLLLASASAHMDLPVSPARTCLLPGDPDPSMPLPENVLRGSRVMPASPGGPATLFIPLPDPESFGLIIHWLYWGDATVIEDALSRGLVSWEGLVHNIDYLDLDVPIKRVVGNWWRKWVKTEAAAQRTGQKSDFFDEDEEAETKKAIGGLGGNESDEEDVKPSQERKGSEGLEALEGMFGQLNQAQS